MTFTSLCEHLERRCGVAAPATLRAKVDAANIAPEIVTWDCIDLQLESLVMAHSMMGNEVFHLELMRTEFEYKQSEILTDEEVDSVSHGPLSAEQESLEAES